jgi:3-(3-hydroxy-phenyl)propionate hydroxylase
MRAVRARGIDVRWNTTVTNVRTDPDGVSVDIAGAQTLRARYAIACDGARSTTRKALGITMDGENLDSRWVIVDVGDITENALAPELVFHYEHLNVLLIPFKGGWRIDLQCKTQADLDRMGTPEGVRAWLPKIVDAAYADTVQWTSTYRFNKLAAATFTDANRRVLLAGEAAHLFPPFGGRGLNSGIVDATRSARAIAQALVAPDRETARAIVDEVALDRRDAARFNMEAAAIGIAIMAPPTAWMKLRRTLAVAILPWSKRARYWLSLGPNGLVGGRPGKVGIY